MSKKDVKCKGNRRFVLNVPNATLLAIGIIIGGLSGYVAVSLRFLP